MTQVSAALLPWPLVPPRPQSNRSDTSAFDPDSAASEEQPHEASGQVSAGQLPSLCSELVRLPSAEGGSDGDGDGDNRDGSRRESDTVGRTGAFPYNP